MLHSYLHYKATLKIGQAEGLGDLKCGCNSESFDFIGAVGECGD